MPCRHYKIYWVHKGKLWFGSSFALDFQQTRCLMATLTIPIETTSTNSNASMGQPHLCFCKRAMCFEAWSVLEIHSKNLKRWLQLLCLLREILYSHLFTLPSKIQISYIKDNQLIVPQPDCYDPPHTPTLPKMHVKVWPMWQKLDPISRD